METAALETLVETLFDEGLKHTNEALNLIVAYHKLFQFTFTEGSDSINSDLALRKDVLCVVDNYYPPVTRKSSSPYKLEQNLNEKESRNIQPKGTAPEKKNDKALFKSRLAERSGNGAYQIDYSKLLAGDNTAPVIAGETSEGGKKGGKTASPDSCFALPLLATELRNYNQQPLRCELTNDEMQRFRTQFLGAFRQ